MEAKQGGRMGPLDGLLSGPRAQRAFLLRIALDPPWAMSIRDEAPLTVMAVLDGHMWVDVGDEPVLLRPGDISIVKGPEHCRLADDPATPTTIIVLPDQQCLATDGRSLINEMMLGVRTWGTNPDGETQLLTGIYNFDSDVSRRLLAAIPRHIYLGADEWDSPLVDLLATEVSKDVPGQEVILDRLLDLLLISAVRAWFERHEREAPGWFTAEGDASIGATLKLIHADPTRSWTVEALAREAGMSRAAYARRFTQIVGEPPMTYLTAWRLTLAADLLRDPGESVGSVAERVGYATPYAFSTAFKRVRGVSPRQYRETAGQLAG
jgi:AraC-like DNA-binding protein